MRDKLTDEIGTSQLLEGLDAASNQCSLSDLEARSEVEDLQIARGTLDIDSFLDFIQRPDDKRVFGLESVHLCDGLACSLLIVVQDRLSGRFRQDYSPRHQLVVLIMSKCLHGQPAHRIIDQASWIP